MELKLLYNKNLLEEKSKALMGIKIDSSSIYINFTPATIWRQQFFFNT